MVAPDQRGYGRTTGWDRSYDGDVASFRLFNLVCDTLGLVAALGYRSVAAVIGHDFGSSVAAWCALLRPDVFPAVVMMSAPFPGPPSLNAGAPSGETIHAALDNMFEKIEALPSRKSGDPHPFVNKDDVDRFSSIVIECAEAKLAWAASH